MTTIYFDFDGVFNAFDRGKSKIDDGYGMFHQQDVTINHYGADRTFTILYRPIVIEWFNSLVSRGHDVRWLTTWRDHTTMFPATFGFVEAPWDDWQNAPPWGSGSQEWGKFNFVRDNGITDAIWVDDHHFHFDYETDDYCERNNVIKITPDDRYGLMAEDIDQIESLIAGVDTAPAV